MNEVPTDESGRTYTLVVTGRPPDLCDQLVELPDAITSGRTTDQVKLNIIDALASLLGDEHAAAATITYDGRLLTVEDEFESPSADDVR